MKDDLLNIVIHAVKDAGEKILDVYNQYVDVIIKPDGSPLTKADQISQDIILNYLELTGLPIVSEEKQNLHMEAETYWLVDPLDGTKDFLAGNDEFTINIALIQQHYPVLGVIYAPALSELYAGIPGYTSWYERKNVRTECHTTQKSGNCRMAVSRFHDHPDVNVFAEINRITERVAIGSALKYGRLAISEVDVFPRLVGSSEWDTAAGQAVLEAAGGMVLNWHTGKPLHYGKTNRRNPRLLSLRTPYLFSDFNMMHYEMELL